MSHRAQKYRSLFPYYGGKSKLADRYTPPLFKQIIEPFAGGASYSLRHYTHDVWLNDLHAPTVALWQFLTSGDAALTLVRERIPFDVAAGTHISELVREGDPEGFVQLVRANMAQGAFGMKGVRSKVSPFGAKAWSSSRNGAGGLRGRLECWIPKIQHWTVTMLPYEQLPNEQATWFVDPPYANAAGRKYAQSTIDYEALAIWCKARQGHAIVCENNDATWLPFQPLTQKRIGIYSDSVTSEMGEAVYEQGCNQRGDFGLPFDYYGVDDGTAA